MDCSLGSMGLFVLAIAVMLCASAALVLGIAPQVRERRRRQQRAEFLRAHLLHHIEMLRTCLAPRDRPMSPEHEHIIDGLYPLAVQSDQLDVEEWQAVLRVHSALTAARYKRSYNKREARVTERLLDEAAAALQSRTSMRQGQGAWWRWRWPLPGLANDNRRWARVIGYR